MKTSNFHNLIDGTFTAGEAKTVLFSLIESKIRYHQLEQFSNQERFGKDLNQSEKRVEQLVKLRSDLKIILEQAAEQKKNVKVNGIIELTFVDP